MPDHTDCVSNCNYLVPELTSYSR